MQANNIIRWVVYFIISILISWVVFSLILMWWKPTFYNNDGSVNWWTTFWVTAVTLIFAWLVTVILGLIFEAFRKNQYGACAPACAPVPAPAPVCAPACPAPNPCEKKC